jgi:hypothetical protein
MRNSCLACWLLAVPATLFLGAPVRSASPEDEAVREAVRKGAKYLQGVYSPRQEGQLLGMHSLGKATLAGMALLESGVPETDPAVKLIAKYVRDSALAQTQTYEISLTIMFLDRLGNPADVPVIQLLGLRLVGGQTRTGGWSYSCGYPLSPQEEAHLRKAFGEARLTSGGPATESPNDPPKKEPKKAVPRNDLPVDPTAPPAEPKKTAPKKDPAPVPAEEQRPRLHPEVAKWAKLVNLGAGDGINMIGAVGDNSNTQFGALGLWVARRHGVPCDQSLALLDKRFRASQMADGSWNYNSHPGMAMPMSNPSPAMTCAGLIGLAVSHGVTHNTIRNRPDGTGPNAKDDGKGIAADPAIKAALKFLGTCLSPPRGQPGPDLVPDPGQRGRRRFWPNALTQNFYFLWSLERVGVIYDLETIGNVDWYTWGATALLDMQNPDGSWPNGEYQGADAPLSTSFALLFLNRANVAKDLTRRLGGKVKDPGVAVLRGGGDVSKVLPDRNPKGTTPPDPVVRPNPANPPAAVTGNDFEKETARLIAALVSATAAERPALLAKLRDTKGGVYTEALARATLRLSGEAQQEAREALARRLMRMTAATLRDMLKDENREIRIGAVRAAGLKEDRQLVPDLIGTLADTDPALVAAARASLKGLSGKDFGPEPGADAAGKANAVTAWQSWWKSQKP